MARAGAWQGIYGNRWKSAVDTFKKYKFVIAFEGSFIDGYWSEKMINAARPPGIMAL